MNDQNIAGEFTSFAQRNWTLFTIALIFTLIAFVRLATRNAKSRKHSKSHAAEKLFKSSMSIGKTSRKKKGKKQRTSEGIGSESKKSTTLTRSLENITKKSDKKKNKAKRKKPSTQQDEAELTTFNTTFADDDLGGGWQIVCTKEQRQAKKEKRHRSETSDNGGGVTLPQDFVSSRTFHTNNHALNQHAPYQSFSIPPTAKDVAPRFARAAAAGEEYRESLRNNSSKTKTPTRLQPPLPPPSTTSLQQRSTAAATADSPLNRWHSPSLVNHASNNFSDSWKSEQTNNSNEQHQIHQQQPINPIYSHPWTPFNSPPSNNNWKDDIITASSNTMGNLIGNQWTSEQLQQHHDIINSAVLSSANSWSNNGSAVVEKSSSIEDWRSPAAATNHHNIVDLSPLQHHANNDQSIWNHTSSLPSQPPTTTQHYQPTNNILSYDFGSVFTAPQLNWSLPSSFGASSFINNNTANDLIESNHNKNVQEVEINNIIGSTPVAADPEETSSVTNTVDPWSADPNVVADETVNADWSVPDVSWSNAVTDDWQAPTAPVKPIPTYFDDSGDEFSSATSGGKFVSDQSSSAVNKKSRRRRKKKQCEVSNEGGSSPVVMVETVASLNNNNFTTDLTAQLNKQEVVTAATIASQPASQNSNDNNNVKTTMEAGDGSDGEWTTLKKRRTRARKDD